jgi:hypothetical protein
VLRLAEFLNSRIGMRVRRLAVPALFAALLATACATTNLPPEVAAKPTSKSTPEEAAKGSRPPAADAPRRLAGRTVADVLKTIGPSAETRLRKRFEDAGVVYPPAQVHLLAFKAERRLELWANSDGAARRVASFPVLADSGTLGPKLREGDYQIPEGIYRVVWLHPNSEYHLSMKLDYPNAFDREQAKRDGRTELGGDIFIHGSDVSIGCLAVGDPAIEELFVLAARVGIERVKVVVAPWDLRRRAPPALDGPQPPWLPDLYVQLSRTLASYR